MGVGIEIVKKKDVELSEDEMKAVREFMDRWGLISWNTLYRIFHWNTIDSACVLAFIEEVLSGDYRTYRQRIIDLIEDGASGCDLIEEAKDILNELDLIKDVVELMIKTKGKVSIVDDYWLEAFGETFEEVVKDENGSNIQDA